MFKKLLRKLFGMEPKEFTFAKVGTGPNQAPPPQIKKPIVKPSGQGTQRGGCFSPATPFDVSNPPTKSSCVVVEEVKGSQSNAIGYDPDIHFKTPSSICYGENAFIYGHPLQFQDDIQPPEKIPKRTYHRDRSGKFSKKPSEKIEQKSKKIKKEPPPKPVLKRPEVCKVFESHLPFGL
jgi:hypothetical protein